MSWEASWAEARGEGEGVEEDLDGAATPNWALLLSSMARPASCRRGRGDGVDDIGALERIMRLSWWIVWSSTSDV